MHNNNHSTNKPTLHQNSRWNNLESDPSVDKKNDFKKPQSNSRWSNLEMNTNNESNNSFRHNSGLLYLKFKKTIKT